MGSNQFEQIGGGAPTPTYIPRQVTGLPSIVAVSAGGSHSLALDGNGRVWAWGRNLAGELGVEGLTQSGTPLLLPLEGVSAIAAGDSVSVALKTDGLAVGSVWSWGLNRGLQPVFTGLSDMKAIADDGSLTALRRDGTVYPTSQWWVHQEVVAIPTNIYAIEADADVWLDRDKVMSGGLWAAPPYVLELSGIVRAWTWDTTAQDYVPGPVMLTVVDNAFLLTDPDNDGLPTWRELRAGTDPYDSDTNDDGLSDGAQLAAGGDPVSLDLDGDGVSNAVEIERGTDPLSADMDGDGASDEVDCFPLDSARSECPPPDPNDTSPPRITLTAPRGITLISVQPSE